MNIIERYVKKNYKVEEHYSFVRIIASKENTWYNKYYGKIFIVNNRLLIRSNNGNYAFPYNKEKLNISGNRRPIISTSYLGLEPPMGQMLYILETHERPENWIEYIKEINKGGE
jgi:hypothetical protein